MEETRKLNLKERLFAKRKRLPTPRLNTLVIMFAVCMAAYVGLSLTHKTADQIPYLQGNQIDTLNLTFVGDVMMGRTFQDDTDANSASDIFTNVEYLLHNSDLTFADLESAVIDPDKTYKPISKTDNSSSFAIDFDTLEDAREAGISVFACANDHSFDYNEKAIAGLVSYFEENQISYSGIAASKETLFENPVITVRDWTIGFMSVTDVYPEEAVCFDHSNRPVVLGTAYQEYTSRLLELSQQCDITVVYMHWGEEGAVDISDDQVSLAHQLIDAGADIVIGCHPQVLQSVETYKDGFIVYSMGDFVYDQGYSHNADTALLQLVVDETKHAEFIFIPIRIREGKPEITENSVFRNMINSKLTQRLDSADYSYDELGCLTVEMDLR